MFPLLQCRDPSQQFIFSLRLAGCQGFDIQMAQMKDLEFQESEQQILKQEPILITGSGSGNMSQEKQGATGKVGN